MAVREGTQKTTLPEREGSRWIRALDCDQLEEDEGFRINTEPPISIYATQGELFCIDDTCTHETFSLAEGWVENCMVECALHMTKFDLRTGAAMTPPARRSVAVHPVTVVAGVVYVAIPDDYVFEKEATDGLA